MPGEPEPFADRHDAGRLLGLRLAERPRPGSVVLGLPRGGAVVAAEVAAALAAPLDVLLVRKLGVPGRAELAMGAIATVAGDVETVGVAEVVAAEHVTQEAFAAVRAAELQELRRREAAYRPGRPPVTVRGRRVVLVDDGVATGATMHAAVVAVRARAAARVTVAVPVGSPGALSLLRQEADELVCLRSPREFGSVGRYYRDFTETGDDEVRRALSGTS